MERHRWITMWPGVHHGHDHHVIHQTASNLSRRVINKNDDSGLWLMEAIWWLNIRSSVPCVCDNLLVISHKPKVYALFLRSVFWGASKPFVFSFVGVIGQKRMQKFDFQHDCDREPDAVMDAPIGNGASSRPLESIDTLDKETSRSSAFSSLFEPTSFVYG